MAAAGPGRNSGGPGSLAALSTGLGLDLHDEIEEGLRSCDKLVRPRCGDRNAAAGAALLPLAVPNPPSSAPPVADDAAGQLSPAGHDGRVAANDVHHID